MKLSKILYAALAALILSSCEGAVSHTDVKPRDKVTFTADSQTIVYNETPYYAEAAPLIYKGYVYVPIDGTLQACGYTTYYNEAYIICIIYFYIIIIKI